ncbi:MAG: Rod shape-determining protein MreD [Cytophagales bacterium]
MTRIGIVTFLSFFAYVLAQVLVLQNLVLFNTAFCFLYIFFILLLPKELNTILLMLIGLVLGFSIDVFYNSLGLHALSLVLMAYLRNYWLAAITPQGGYDVGVPPTLSAYGLQWFLVYTFPLIFVHHFVVFFVEAAGFHLFWYTMLKVMMSLLFTLTIALILQYLSTDRRR